MAGYIIGKPRRKAVYDALASETLTFLEQLSPLANRTELAQDPHQSTYQHLLDMSRGGRLVMGRVVSALPLVNWYRVQLEDGDGDFPCCKLSQTGLTPLGARDANLLTPNSQVLIYKHHTGNHGFILGSAPEITQDGNQRFSDWINQGGGTGFVREGYYNEIFSLLRRDGGVLDFSADRPMDQSCLDYTIINELGGRLHLDAFLMQFMVDEMCGLQLFYHDQLARLCGYNLDIRSAVHSLSARNDDGECRLHYGESLYPWETLGAFADGARVHREVADKDVLFDQPYGKLEPATDDQLPFFRYEEFGGYLGQGHMRQMCLPPQGSTNTVFRLSQNVTLPGVFREQIFPTGAYALESAKSITIAKRAPIAIPKQKKLPEDYQRGDGAGDNPENYKASGKYGDGDEHVVRDLQPRGYMSGLLNVAAIWDLHAYTFNWQGLHPFHYHSDDYKLPEEADLPLNKVQEGPDFSELASSQWLTRPTPVKLRVDDRYGQVNYFKALSHLSFLDDGSVTLFGGGGAAITLTGGSVEISAPGDIWLRSGRSTLVWGGDDIILKAQNSIDATSSKKDVRLKAEGNLEMLGGNGGSGSVLIESKAAGTSYDYEGKYGEDVSGSGVVIKSPHGKFSVLAAGVYLRTGSSGGHIGSGDIVLDADKGQANIITVCSKWEQYLDDKLTTTFGVEQPRAVHKYDSSRVRFGTLVEIEGQLAVDGNGMFVRGNVDATGDFSGNGLASSLGQVGYLGRNPAGLAQVNSRLDGISASSDQDLAGAASAYQTFTEQYYAAGKIGSEGVEQAISFTLRTPAQYNTRDFKIYQSPWQQLAQASGQLRTWTETVVQVGGRELMPYPGTEKWRDEDQFLQLDANLYDFSAGRDKPRGEGAYDDPELPSWTVTSLDGHYPVTL